jgi:hypothetical protein
MKSPGLYFDAGASSGGYWLRQEDGRFLKLDSGNLKLHLTASELPDSGHPDLKRIEWAMLQAQRQSAVDYAGPLAGYRVGMHQIGTRRVLVTTEAKIPAAKRGDWSFLETYLHELLGPGRPMWYFMAWVKLAHESLTAGTFRPGQMLVLCGPAECGKTFAHWLITECLGGRVAKPYKWMTAETGFNGHLAEAESLVIDDESASTDIRARRAFGAAIKQVTVGGELDIRALYRQAIALPTFRRIHLSVNDEPENLIILPPMDGSIADKVMLFKCHRASCLHDDRARNQEEARKAIPGFLDACRRLKIKGDAVNSRFGVKAYHDPEVLEVLASLAPETKLLTMIDEAIEEWPWKGTATALERHIRAGELGYDLDRMTKGWSAAVGVWLGRLARQFPHRFRSTKVEGRVSWHIGPPDKGDESPTD